MGKMEPIPVLAAVIEREGRFLICRRPAHKRHGGLWEFPGGKIETGESPLDAARRELAEELHLVASAIEDLLLAVQDAGSPFIIQFYRVTATGQPNPVEHSEIAWVAGADLLRLPLAPSDERFARWLQESRQC